MIEVKNLKKVYKTKKGVVVKALDGVSLKLPETGMVFILGKSGSGKSTLLNVVGGLDSIDSGEIIIKGTSAKDFKQTHYDSYRNTYIGFIFQEYNVLEELTVGANIALAIELQGRKATNEEMNSILEEVDLAGYGARKPNELSGGQKQRVAIARALVKRPEIIMADEPTGALDSTTGKQVFDTLKKLSKDKLVLIVSHDREFSEQYADRIIELADGKVISDVEKLDSVAETAPAESDDSENLSYEDGTISVRGGYMLTEEDRLAINEYLKNLQNGVTIKLKEKKSKKKISSDAFIPTDETKIVNSKSGDFKLIKSKLSMKNAFKLGSGALKYKKFRLVFTIFLSLIAFTLFGLADTIAAYDSVKTASSSIADSGVPYASFIKEVKAKYGDGDNDFYWVDYDTYLSPENIEKIKDETGIDVVGVYNKNLNASFDTYVGKENDDKNLERLFSSRFSGFVAIDEDFLDSHDFELYGELPEKDKNEIVITSFMYDYFREAGYVSYGDKIEILEITTHDDIIGKTIDFGVMYNNTAKFKIVGIIDTNFDYSRYEALTDKNVENTMNMLLLMALSSELESARNYSYACLGFVNESLIESFKEQNEGSAENINGYVSLMYVKDPDAEYLYEEEGNVVSESSFHNVYYLSNVRDKVIWLNGEKSSLADNQIIISLDALSNNLYDWELQNKLYDSSILRDFEKTLYDRYESGNYGIYHYVSLENIFSQLKYFTAYKHAYENPSAAKNLLEQWSAGDGVSKEKLENDDMLPAYFAEQVENGHSYSQLQSQTSDYFNTLVSRYSLEKIVLSEDFAKSLVASVERNGEIYYSYDYNTLRFIPAVSNNIRHIISYKLAAENFSDAIRFYELQNSNADFVPTEYVVGNYADYLMGYREEKNFTPQNPVSLDAEIAKVLFGIKSSVTDGTETIINWNSYISNNSSRIKNVEIVGVLGGDNSYGYAVLSDNLLNSILGANVGGIYSFALGEMPSDQGEIFSTVKFSKEIFGDDSYRFTLKNNVTEELSMVDEILDVLGQVFLYVGIGFAVFASLMLTNFIGTSISYKKQEIGILRAIGSRSADVFRIFFAESFIIAMINYVLSIAGTLTVTVLINNILRNDVGLLITFLNFGIRQIALLLLVSLAVAFIATFFPVKKIASMKPIDAIKNRK